MPLRRRKAVIHQRDNPAATKRKTLIEVFDSVFFDWSFIEKTPSEADFGNRKMIIMQYLFYYMEWKNQIEQRNLSK